MAFPESELLAAEQEIESTRAPIGKRTLTERGRCETR